MTVAWLPAVSTALVLHCLIWENGIDPESHDRLVSEQMWTPPESRWQVSSVSELGVGFKGSEHTWENWGSLQKRWGVNWASRYLCLFWRQYPDSFKNWSLVPIICLLNGSCKYTSKRPWSGEILSIFQCCTNGQCLCMIQWHKHVQLLCPVPFLWRPLTPLVLPALAKGTLC